MTLKERFEGMLRMVLLVFVLASAAFLSAITAMRFAIQGREVEMPNLAGKSSAEAMALLTSRGLGMKVADRVYSDLPANAVVRQSPPAGVHMKVSQQGHVVLSLGGRKVNVPGLEGKSLRVARIELLRAGLQVGEVSSVPLPDYPADAVVQQYPRPGGTAGSPRVNVLVSQGAREPAYIMPHLVGLPQADAFRLLFGAGLKVTKISIVQAPGWPQGTVTDQTPVWGTKVTAAISIELQVAE